MYLRDFENIHKIYYYSNIPISDIALDGPKIPDIIGKSGRFIINVYVIITLTMPKMLNPNPNSKDILRAARQVAQIYYIKLQIMNFW